MAPNRKPPPRLTSPPPPSHISRKPSLHTTEKDEYGRTIAWGASRSRPGSSTSRFGLPLGQPGVTGSSGSSATGATGEETYRYGAREGGLDSEGMEGEGVGLLVAPTPQRSDDGHRLSNFEAAVAALRSSGPASGAGASRDGTSVVSSSYDLSGPGRSSQPRTITTNSSGHYNLVRNQPIPVDPNYPSTIQFHKQAGYMIPTARPVMAQTTRDEHQHHQQHQQSQHQLPPVYRQQTSVGASPGGLPLPVSMTRDGQGKRAMGLGIGMGGTGGGRPLGEESPTSTTARRERNVSGPLRRRGGRRSRSPTPFPDDDDEDDEGGRELIPGRGKENGGGGAGAGRPDPFGPIEVDLATRQKAELTAIYDTAVKKEALRKGYAMYVDRDAGVDDHERLLRGDHDEGREGDMAEVHMVPTYEGREAGLFDKRKSMDLVSYHTKDPRSSLYGPYDQVDEKAGLDIGDYQHHDDDDGDAKTYGSNEDDDDDMDDEKHHPPSTAHFGPAPVGRIVRRHLQKKAKKVVELTEGNLVIDLKIPTKLEGFLPAATRGRMGEDGDEVLFTR